MRKFIRAEKLLIHGLVSAFLVVALAEASRAQPCGTGTCGGSEACISDSGVLTSTPPACVLLAGPGFPFPGPYALQNLGGFSVGDEVTIEGCATLYFGICGATFFISQNTIELQGPALPALDAPGRIAAIIATSAVALGALLRRDRFRAEGSEPASRRR